MDLRLGTEISRILIVC